MEVDFIDQDDAVSGERVFQCRVRECHSPRQVADHRQGALFSVRELVDPKHFAVLGYFHA